MPVVGRMCIHPIKALDGVEVRERKVLPSGALALDRRWAFVDARGNFVNGKNRPEIHAIRAEYDVSALEVAIDGRVYSLEKQKTELEAWISEHLDERVELRENRETGFPDDLASPGPTFVARESLALVASWFELTLAEARLRFRTNIELDEAEPLWEDRLYGSVFGAGDVRVNAINPCKRCVVPSRAPLSGVASAGFQKRFAELRRATLPAGADAALFDHYYRFAVNTRIAASEAGKVLRSGDEVSFPLAKG